jgi:signal transduction histidine kinase/ActR/RegA family two-component response regulator/type II secretory pathway pseudopilin PulG
LHSTSSHQDGSASQWSVRIYLFSLALACLLPGILAATGLFVYQYQEGRAQLEKNTLHTVRALGQAIENHFLKVQAAAQTLATSSALARGDLASFHQRAQEIVAIEDLTSNVVLQNEAGHQLVNTLVDFGQPLPTSDQVKQVSSVFAFGTPVISDVFTGTVSNRPTVAATVPVFLNDKVVYALSLGVLPMDINEVLLAQGLPAGWVAAVLDTKGTIFGRNIEPERFVGNRATPGLYNAMMTSGEGMLEATTQEGTPVLTFHSRSPATGWTVALGIPRADLEAAFMQRFAVIAGSVALLFGAGLLLAWFMGDKIARSIRSLSGTALALGRSQPLPVPHVQIKEAAEVAVAMNRAASLLAERDAALHVREHELAEAHRLAKFGTWYWDLQSGEVRTSESVTWIYGRDVPSFERQRGTLLPVESWERIEAALQETLKTGKGYDLEIQVNHGDGYPIWVNAKCEAMRDERNEVIGLRGTIQDITERKGYEDALRDNEMAAHQAAYEAEMQRRRLAAVLEATPVGVFVTDAKGAVTEMNEAGKQIWGFNHPVPESVDDYREWRGWWADGSEHHGCPIAHDEWPMVRALKGEEACGIIEIAPFDDPQARRILMMSGAVIRNGEGAIIGGVVAQMDVTERIRVEEELRHADRRKDEFLAMLAHELRNPLAPISAAADLLRLGTQDPAGIKYASTVITRQVRHMAGLVEDLLDVSRVTRGLVRLDRQHLDFNLIAREAIEQVKPVFDAKGHALDMQLPDRPAPVMGDPKRLVQIVVNLLSNAAKFTPVGGHIKVAVEDEKGAIRLTVEDDGIGMTPDIKSSAFDMFVQGERTPDRSQGGLGIGLALVKSLVELHGGLVGCDSEGPGKGSRFTVTLPMTSGPLSQTKREDSDSLLDTAKTLKVMIVDDNVDAAQTLTGLVEALGHHARVEYSSHAALERALLEPPDLCLLDIGLPEMDGRELARRLRAQPETAHAMLVAITGYAQAQDRQSIKQAGFDHHFAKPIDMTQLAAILSEAGKRAAK